ncbi:hypothetical protein AAH978_17480 [Streptomyces sp. ZYX-F-203]
MRREFPVTLAILTSASLFLSACGNGLDRAEDSDSIIGVETEKATPSDIPSDSADQSVQRPDITLPADVKDVFEGWKTGNDEKDLILDDVARSQTAVNKAIVEGDVDAPGLSFYYAGEALITSAAFVQSWLDADLTYTGTTRYFNPRVELFDDESAGVSFCADETMAPNKDRRSGKVDKEPPSRDSYILYNTRVEKDENGVWQTTSGLDVRGSAKCIQE